MGDSGSGKTSLIADFAKWTYEKTGKTTLFYAVDGGSDIEAIRQMVDAGIIWGWNMRTRGEAFDTCSKASRGYWPKEWDTKTGKGSSVCDMVKPVEQEYTLLCAKGHEVKKSNQRKAFNNAIKCPKCQVPTALQTRGSKITSTLRVTPGFENVGAVAYDGLSSMQDWVMEDMADMTARGVLVGESTALGGKIVSGDSAFGANNRSHYGFAQIQAQKWILASTAITFLDVPPIWTALETRGSDDQTKLPVYGPQIAGRAKTDKVPSWVGNCLGAQIVHTKDNKKIHRLWLTEYKEADNIPHLCKTRALPGSMPDFIEDEVGVPHSGFSLGVFFDKMEEATKGASENLKITRSLPTKPSGRLTGIAPIEVEKPTFRSKA
jgi:hypothetical protein